MSSDLTIYELVRRWEGACPDSMQPRWCGCGNPENVWFLIRDLVLRIGARSAAWREQPPRYDAPSPWEGYPPGVPEVLSGLLDDLGLTEHGGSYYGCWLTPLGEQVAQLLGPLSDEQISIAYDQAQDAAGCVCACNEPKPECVAAGRATRRT